MTVLVTGSAGHLGEALVRMARENGRPVRGLDIKPSSFTSHVGCITDRAFVGDCLKGVRSVIHAAALHKPHVATHSRQDFVNTNITGTLVMLEEAARAGVDSFVFTSTTSAFGAALTPGPDAPATWITEDVLPVPKNIYGATKIAAEQLCELFARRENLPVVILRTARFFPEADDNPETRSDYETLNAQVNELLHRRADIEDMAAAHFHAIEKAGTLRFGCYIVSATTPFTQTDLAQLPRDAPTVVRRLFPDYADIFAERGWTMFPKIDRVYVNDRARAALGWKPKRDFRFALDALRAGSDFRSHLALRLGSKGYHAQEFADGPYPVLP